MARGTLIPNSFKAFYATLDEAFVYFRYTGCPIIIAYCLFMILYISINGKVNFFFDFNWNQFCRCFHFIRTDLNICRYLYNLETQFSTRGTVLSPFLFWNYFKIILFVSFVCTETKYTLNYIARIQNILFFLQSYIL